MEILGYAETNMNYILIALIWAAYCVQHSFLISTGFTGYMKQRLKDKYAYYRLFYVIISTVLIIPVLYYSYRLQSEVIFSWQGPWLFLRYALITIGLYVFLKSFFFDYDSLAFMGIRQIADRKNTAADKDMVIKKQGLLGMVRHPMYLATLILIWSNTTRISDVVVSSVLTAYIYIGTLLEERKLVLEFGEVYKQYQREVPMLIPFLKPRP